MSATAAADCGATSKTEEGSRLESLLGYLLRNGVVVDSDEWVKDNRVSGMEMKWPESLQEYLQKLDGTAFERAVVHLVDLAKGREAGLQASVARKLNVLMWNLSALAKMPTEIDPVDLHCNALAGYCMAVVRGVAPLPESITDFWNSCVDTLNKHCTERRMPFLAAAALAYATDCIIERDARRKRWKQKEHKGSQEPEEPKKPLKLELPHAVLMNSVPMLGECWACLCAYTGTDIADATEFVLEHNFSIAKLLSATPSHAPRQTIVGKLAEHLGYEFDDNEVNHKPADAESLKEAEDRGLLEALDSAADENLFSSSSRTDKVTYGWLDFMKNHTAKLRRKDYDEFIDEGKESVVRVMTFTKHHKQYPFISANYVLRELCGDETQKVLDPMSTLYSQHAWKDQLAKRWTTALLCTCCSTTCMLRNNVRPNLLLLGFSSETKDGIECDYADTKVRWTDGKETKHCAVYNVGHLVQEQRRLTKM